MGRVIIGEAERGGEAGPGRGEVEFLGIVRGNSDLVHPDHALDVDRQVERLAAALGGRAGRGAQTEALSAARRIHGTDTVVATGGGVGPGRAGVY